MRIRIHAVNEAHLALNKLRLGGVITSFKTNFVSSRELGFTPQVCVWIAAQDELAMERVRRRVVAELSPHIKGVAVTVYPGSSGD